MSQVFLNVRNLVENQEKERENMTQKRKYALSVKSIKSLNQHVLRVVSMYRGQSRETDNLNKAT
jgi:hypothetical protein